jgi:phosphoribosylanthranilate isomerase
VADLQVKVCGLTNVRDAELAIELGAAMLGFNFYLQSPRYIQPKRAARIIAGLPRNVEPIGVFVNASPEQIHDTWEISGIRAVQLHGDENAALCREIETLVNLRIIKALRTTPGFQPENALSYPADTILIDAHCSEYGGSGRVADWGMARAVAALTPRVILAGGLSADNVVCAIREVGPYAVDVCSGVESAPGQKDAPRLRAFFDAVSEARGEDKTDG